MDLNPSTVTATLDMSVSGVTAWLPLDKQYNGFDFAWPATGAPAGTISVELTSDATDLTRVVVVDTSAFSAAPTQPTGAANRTCWDSVRTCEPYARVRYVPSGSTGAGATLSIVITGKL